MKILPVSGENAEYQIIQALKTNRVKRRKTGEVFAEGIECVKQADAAGAEITRVITPDYEALSDWGKNFIARHGEAKIIRMAPSLYAALCDKAEPAELVITAKNKTYTLDDITMENPFVLVFDRPGDLGNLGSVVRSADAFGVDAVVIAGHGVDSADPKAIRASLGAFFRSKIITAESTAALERFFEKQKKANGMEIIGADSAGEKAVHEAAPARPVTLVVGNEAKGISLALKALCDKVVKIPMTGNVNSLNAAAAASILMWEIFRKSR